MSLGVNDDVILNSHLGTSRQPAHAIPTFEGVSLDDLHRVGILDDASGYLQAANSYLWRSEDITTTPQF